MEAHLINEIDRAADALNHLDAGCARDEWVRAGMAAKSAGLSFDDFNNWSSSTSNYAGENGCRTVWNSFSDAGAVTAGTLYGMAFAQGWADPNKKRIEASNGNRPISKPSSSAAQPVKQAADNNAVDIWNRCIPADAADAYIYRKQGNPDGLRVYPANVLPLIIRGQNVAGYLVIPCWSGGVLQTLQFIPQTKGDKLNLAGASFGDGFHSVGEMTNLAYIVEGIGQAWAVNKATGKAAIVCFGAGRMAPVAKTLRAKFPSLSLVIVPDKGVEEKAAKIAAEVSGLWVEMPDEKSSNYDANDYALEYGTAALAALLLRSQAPLLRFKLLLGADLCNAPPMRWMVRGVLPAEGLVAVYGASGSGKSFLTLAIAFAVASGTSWCGHRVTQAPVTYACLEGEAGMGKRTQGWCKRHSKPVPDALRFIVQAFHLLTDVHELAKAVIAGGGKGGLIIIDTLNRASPGADENSSVDMGNIIAAAKELQILIGGVVLLVHHTGKDSSKGLRGHSSLYAALDGAIEVIKTDSRQDWIVAKSKDDVTGHAHPFKLEIVAVGFDDEGEAITSCVAVPNESIEAIKQAKRPALRSNQKIANEVIGEALRKSLHFAKEDAPIGRPCIQYIDAVTIVAESIPADSKHKLSRAKTAITGLVERGYLASKGDWLWDK
jgi:putative DNA primase/helicase